MFSMIPSTGILVLAQKLISFRTSDMETACGVVTTTAPARYGSCVVWEDFDVVESVKRLSAMEICSSEVPVSRAKY